MGIVVDPAVYAEVGDSRHANESVVVVGASDPQAAARALRLAGERFGTVAEDGREFATWDEADEEGLYTPNYVSEVESTPRGPYMYVDCKGCIPEPMRARLVLVLVEELERAGIRDAHVEVPTEQDRRHLFG